MKCPNCNGSGEVLISFDCENCYGDGVVECPCTDCPSGDDIICMSCDNSKLMIDECSECFGDGQYEDYDTCPECSGDGEIDE